MDPFHYSDLQFFFPATMRLGLSFSVPILESLTFRSRMLLAPLEGKGMVDPVSLVFRLQV